jgi:hypothetical protein
MFLVIDNAFPHYMKFYVNKGFTPSLALFASVQTYSMNVPITAVTGALSNYKVLLWASCYNYMGTI